MRSRMYTHTHLNLQSTRGNIHTMYVYTYTPKEPIMSEARFAIGFTTLFFLSLFVGWNVESSAFQQIMLVFAGFNLGGTALIIVEEL